MIPKPQYAKALCLQPFGSPRIVFDLAGVLATVQLDDQLDLEADKIDDVVADRRLAAELSTQLTKTKFTPEQAFFVGHVFPKLASEVMVHEFSPPTPTLPHKGGGGRHSKGHFLPDYQYVIAGSRLGVGTPTADVPRLLA
jgi:hypothetical protein